MGFDGKNFPEGINVGNPTKPLVINSTGMDFSNARFSSSPLLFSGMTLQQNTNVLRGIDVTPTRASGWTAFSGTVTTSPAQVYTDYRELHTAGTAEVLGIGSFPYMDSGASCQSLFALQAISYVSAGSTVTTASGAPGTGIFAVWGKAILDGMTFNSGGVAAAAFLSVQSNVTDVSGENVSIINMENASGKIKDVIYLKDTVPAGITNFLTLAADGGTNGPASLTNGSLLNDISATANAGWIRVVIGSTTRYIALYAAKA